MNLTKSQKRLAVILGIILLYAATDFFINREDYLQFYFSEQAKIDTLTQQSIAEPARVTHPKLVTELKWKRNPFRELGIQPEIKKKKAPQKVKLILQAITCSENNSFVMINDLILKEGEFIAGCQIDKIYANRVRLSEKGKSFYLQTK